MKSRPSGERANAPRRCAGTARQCASGSRAKVTDRGRPLPAPEPGQGPKSHPSPRRSSPMRRPNYRFERAERDRSKQAKKEEKLRRQQERTAAQTSESSAELAPADQPRED